MAAGVTTFGLVSATGTVMASNFCPRSPGYWMNHWHDKLGESVNIPPAGTLEKSEIQALLAAPTRGDKVNIMAKQYVATYLNLLLRPDPDNTCANMAVAVDGIGTVEWEHVKNSAQNWLGQNGWDGTAHDGKRDWSPDRSVEGAPGEVDGEVVKDALDAVNNNEFDEIDWDCGNDEESDGGTGGPPEHAGPSR
jgi:hypothetical protein